MLLDASVVYCLSKYVVFGPPAGVAGGSKIQGLLRENMSVC